MVATFFLLVTSVMPPTADLAILRIQSQSGVEVIWEGVSLGSTDGQGLLAVEEIPPGRYTITLHKEGFREISREIELMAGELSTFRLDLLAVNPPRRKPKPAPLSRVRPAQPKAVSRPVAKPPLAKARPEPSAESPPPAANSPSRTERAIELPLRSPSMPSGEVRETEAAPAAPVKEIVAETGVAGGSGRTWFNPWFLVFILAVGTGLYLAGRLRGNVFYRDWSNFSSEVALEVEQVITAPHRPESWEQGAREGKNVSQVGDNPAFIEDLKRREKNLVSNGPRRSRRPQPEVIDADFIEVIDAEVDV